MKRINNAKAEARDLVDGLHFEATRHSGGMRDLLERAACLLDAYQAGLELATPHPATGYRLAAAIETNIMERTA